MNLAEAFEQSVASRAQKTAVFWDEKEFTYATLLSQSVAVACTTKSVAQASADTSKTAETGPAETPGTFFA